MKYLLVLNRSDATYIVTTWKYPVVEFGFCVKKTKHIPRNLHVSVRGRMPTLATGDVSFKRNMPPAPQVGARVYAVRLAPDFDPDDCFAGLGREAVHSVQVVLLTNSISTNLEKYCLRAVKPVVRKIPDVSEEHIAFIFRVQHRARQ
jgi:hypothetical protein